MQVPLIGKVQRPAPWVVGLVTAGLVGASGIAFVATHRLKTPVNVTNLTVPAQSQDLTVRITATGTIVPVQTVNLSPKSAGRVQALYVEQGDRVQAGEVIALMEHQDIDAQLIQAKAAVAQAKAQLDLVRAGSRPEEISQAEFQVRQAQAQVEQAQVRLNLAQERVRRNQTLADEGAISRDRLDEVLNEAQTAQANLEQAQARVREAQQRTGQVQQGSRPQEIARTEAQLAEAIGRQRAVESQRNDTVIRAPFAGVITQKYATEGAFVTPTTSASTTSSATSTSIVSLASGLEILAQVPEVDISQIKLNQPVEIKVDAYPDKTFTGRVRLIAPAAVQEQNVTSFQVRIALKTGQEVLRSGMNTDVTFLGDRLPQAIVVPTVAIVTRAGEPGVLIPDAQNKPQFQPVVIGPTIGNQTQVLKGLEPGTAVFTELPPGQKLEDITKVKTRLDEKQQP